MDFPFNVNDIFSSRINRIQRNLLPHDFKGDVRAAWKCEAQVCDIVDAMGLASARAQGLQKAITTGEKLKSNEHILYLLTNHEGNGEKGVVVGLLKVGRKKLFVFDSAGKHYEMEPLCVLDFYIHESMQRMGCGKLLYEYMLKEENIKPQHLAIDRPSEKFLAFLHKHYGLSKIVPQANNYVIFEEFFSNLADNEALTGSITASDSTPPWRSHLIKSFTKSLYGSADDINTFSSRSPNLERHRARKPSSSIGIIIHHPAENHHSNRDSLSPKYGFFSSPGHPSGSGESVKRDAPCSSSVIIEPKSPKSISPLHHQSVKNDIKFGHTPLW